MTHTLHRRAGVDGLQDDFIIMAMPARGFNNDAKVIEKLQSFLTIFSRHNPDNMGAMGIGHLYESTPPKIIEKVYFELPMVHGVFSNREDVVAALKDIKTVDMGISVIVTGLVDATDCCARDAGLKRHSINYSLGIWGKTELLPDEKYLQISSMCGHAMISVNLIKKMLGDVKQGSITLDQAAAELAKPCVCGIFNGARARRVLEELI